MGILDFHRVPDKALPERLSEGELNATYVRFEDENGDPLPTRNVVIKVDSTSGEIIDIVSEA
ncbi:hypothetical protein [Paenarthrobacter nitroguajacolicus]|uniref:hypothetical protein n=1 Tax=Paenarthrobacter nitroguajacolicus TaxID=211146 RepID=UPI0015B7FF8B|nr:hypothetical protein [Paenarthrobacter nitroguajacolicus]NWL32992.1 hypothetical protein [Paenarthrobacter nitroguajacolicus]